MLFSNLLGLSYKYLLICYNYATFRTTKSRCLVTYAHNSLQENADQSLMR